MTRRLSLRDAIRLSCASPTQRSASPLAAVQASAAPRRESGAYGFESAISPNASFIGTPLKQTINDDEPTEVFREDAATPFDDNASEDEAVPAVFSPLPPQSAAAPQQEEAPVAPTASSSAEPDSQASASVSPSSQTTPEKPKRAARPSLEGAIGGVSAKLETLKRKKELDTLPWEKKWALMLSQQEAQAGAEKGTKIVVYTSSVSIVKQTFAQCAAVRKIFQNKSVMFEERDVFLNTEYNDELHARLDTSAVPQVFFDGVYLGDSTRSRR